MRWRSFAVLSLLAMSMVAASVRAQDVAFSAWAESLKHKAIAQGISPRVVEEAFEGLEPDESVIILDRKQPESKVTLSQYLKNTITQRRIDKGRAMLAEHSDILAQVSNRYGVPANYVVALWAIESDFGRQQGDFSVIRSLATLAYEGRRAEFFSKELIAALKIIESEDISAAELTGSWAGAMGNCQFMPTTFLQHAVDANGDNHRDIWQSEHDSFASIANYLSSIGWDGGRGWGRRVRLPADFKAKEADIKQGHTADYWAQRGLIYEDGILPKGDAILYAIYPGNADEGALLITENYKVLLQWNRSRYFATAVGTLADALKE